MTTCRLSLWSGPRHVATALMYAFAQRPDTQIIDEPLYGHYLRRTRAPHPGRDRVLGRQVATASAIVQDQLLAPMDLPVRFVKHMTHHLVGVNLDFLSAYQHVMLIRDPRQVLPSLQAYLPHPTLLDTAYQMQHRLYHHLEERGLRPLLIRAETLRTHPEATLRRICRFVDLDFQPNMLCWPPGTHPEEGIWGQYWYQTLHQSTGFHPIGYEHREMPQELTPLLEACDQYYWPLAEMAIQEESNFLTYQTQAAMVKV